MRIRSIRPEFWSSEDIAALDWPTRLIFIGLWSYVDDNGAGRDVEKLIVADLFPLEDDPRDTLATVSRALQTLSERGLITRYTVDGKPYLHITTWATHQKIDRPAKDRYPLPTSANAEARDTLATPSREVRDTFATGEGEKGRRGEVVTPPSADADEDEADPFDDFWDLYPRKVEKQDARKAWRAALKKTTASEIIDALKEYPFSEDRQKIKYPATWLNKGSWEDDPTEVRGVSNVHQIRNGMDEDMWRRTGGGTHAPDQPWNPVMM